MPQPLRVLVVEDVEDDCALEIEALKTGGFGPVVWKRVETREQLIAALVEPWDLILSDYTLPVFDGRAALEVVRHHNSDVPFLLVSGTVGEEIAADVMRCGANDIIIKDNLWRLVPAVERELRDAVARRERRDAEASLRESERKYRSVVEQAFDGIGIVDRNGAFLEANRSALAMTGYSEEEFTRYSVTDLIDPEDLRTRPLVFSRLEVGQAITVRRVLVRKDGSRFPADISATALDDGHVALIVRDVSRQVETEHALARRERYQRAIAELGAEVAGGVDSETLMDRAADLIADTLEMEFCRIAEFLPNGAQVRARTGCRRNPSDRTCNVTEESIRRVIGAGGFVAFEPGHSDVVHSCFQDEGIVAGFSVGIGTVDHPLAVIDVHTRSARPVTEDDRPFLQSISSLLAAAIEQKHSEEAMRRSEERFRSYFELDLVGMASTFPDGSWIGVNDRLCEMLGYTRSELWRTTWPELTHPDDLALDMANFKAVLAGESNGYSMDKRFIRKDGTIFHGTISVGCVRHPDGTIDHFVALLQDITRRKLAENELFRRQEEFRALVENAPDVITRFDRAGRQLYINPAVERYTGIPAWHFIGKTVRESGMPEAVSAAFERALTEVFGTGEERDLEFTLFDGHEHRVFQGRIAPEFDSGGDVEFALGVTRDITAIRDSETRLRESEAQLASAQRIANIGSWEMNLDTGRRTWSQEVFRIVGRPAGDPPPEQEVMDAIHPEDRPAVIRAHRDAADFGEMQCVEHRMTIADGSERIFSILIEPQKNAAGRVIKLTGTVQDVTELRRAENSLRQSEQRLRDLIESANDAILTLDNTGRALEVNPAVVRLMQEPAEVLVGRHITHSIHPDHVAKVAQGLATVIEKGGVAHIDAPVKNGRGDYVYIEASASRQTRKGADAIFVIARDVTEQRRAQAERQALMDKIELLLESTYEGIISVDPEGRCTMINRAAATMLGYTQAEVLGNNVHNLIHDRRPDGSPYPQADCPITAASRQSKPVRVLSEIFWRRDRSSFPVEAFISPIQGTNGATIGMVCSFIDVSERQFLQTELERANRLTGLGRVAATMSHEFNNVLMGIQPFAEVLTRTSKEPKVLDAAKRITQSVQRGRRVTEELRGFTRPVQPVRRPVDVRKWLPDCAAELRRLLPTNVQLAIDLEERPMTVEADREQISQVMSNTMINARDAIGGELGTITLRARITIPGEHFTFGTLPGTQQFVHLSVTDDGPGISPENLARIMEPFFTTKKNGTGLGLAITHQIITLHGGHLFVESEAGEGTVVHILLPLSSRPEEKAAPPAAKPRPRRHDSTRVLLIEDDLGVSSGLGVLLRDEGLNVYVAVDGEEAMKLMEIAKPEALVVDIDLPDCDGFKLYERIRARFGPVPVVFSSGHADQVKLEQYVPDGDVKILTKPYPIEMLLQELDEVRTAAARQTEATLSGKNV
jgi:PAS domain S-box-containing protein